MKKILAMLFILGFMFIITSCGPNSDYYNLGSETYYYFINEPLIIDPYDFIRENNSWIGISNPIIRRNPQGFYDVTVEYRKQGYKDSYKELELDEDSMINFEKPNNDLGNESTYEFKIHFLDKETKDEKEMINYYGVFTFKRSPAYLDKKVVSAKLNETYNLLDNVVKYEGENKLTPSDLEDKYNITYEVLLEDDEVTVTEEGKVTLDKVGKYKVVLTLETTTGSTPDGNSGATPQADNSDAESAATPGESDDTGGETITLVMNFEINVTE